MSPATPRSAPRSPVKKEKLDSTRDEVIEPSPDPYTRICCRSNTGPAGPLAPTNARAADVADVGRR
jgi:hypothetical protein